MKTKQRRVRQNIWGNWKGYFGSKKVADFGIDEREARAWQQGGPLESQYDWTRPLPGKTTTPDGQLLRALIGAGSLQRLTQGNPPKI